MTDVQLVGVALVIGGVAVWLILAGARRLDRLERAVFPDDRPMARLSPAQTALMHDIPIARAALLPPDTVPVFDIPIPVRVRPALYDWDERGDFRGRG